MQKENVLPTTVKLNNGLEMPLAGFGTGDHGEDKEYIALLKEVVKAGYRHIDTARLYNTEHLIGEALQELISEGVIKREDIWITSKLWNDKNWGTPEEQMQKTLTNLKVDYVDLYLIHNPCGGVDENGKMRNFPLHILWGEMEKLLKKGLTRTIGVSNFNVQSLVNLLSFCEIPPAVNQYENNPYNQLPDLTKFCQRFNIHVTAFSPFFRGGINNTGGTKVIGARLDMFGDPVLVDIAKAHGRTVGQVIQNWLLLRGLSVIPKTARVERLAENLDIFSFRLTEEDCRRIDALDRNTRSVDTRIDLEKHLYSNFPVHY